MSVSHACSQMTYLLTVNYGLKHASKAKLCYSMAEYNGVTLVAISHKINECNDCFVHYIEIWQTIHFLEQFMIDHTKITVRDLFQKTIQQKIEGHNQRKTFAMSIKMTNVLTHIQSHSDGSIGQG